MWNFILACWTNPSMSLLWIQNFDSFLQSQSTLPVQISGKPISCQNFLGVVLKPTCLVSYCNQPACGLSAPLSVSALYARRRTTAKDWILPQTYGSVKSIREPQETETAGREWTQRVFSAGSVFGACSTAPFTGQFSCNAWSIGHYCPMARRFG